VSSLTKRAQKIAKEVSENLDDILQVELQKKGWEEPINFEAKRGKINLVYKRSHSDNLFNNEYGSEGQAPNSVLRPLIDSVEPMVVNAIAEDVLNDLFAKGILP
jgi:hypothetical protein